MSIEAWVTDPAGAYLAHLERSTRTPYRRFAVSIVRRDPGAGSLEYHLDNPDAAALLEDGNLVWMRYRGRTRAWIVEQRQTVLDAGEHQTDWVKVSGRGARQLTADRLVFPPAFAEGANTDPATWGPDNQWRRFVDRAAGEMLWDLIAESNGRGFAEIVRGTVESTGADGWTQDLRFDTLADVIAAVEAAYGGAADLEGLTFSYLADPGTDRSTSVIFEEGADLLKVDRSTSDRDTLSWAVAEGVGEGVTAKLAVANDPSVRRRREGYVDAKDAGNVPLVALRAATALVENTRRDSIALEVAETRYQALVDYDLHDTIRVIAPSRAIDASARIVALYLAEGDDERVRVGIDVNSLREDRLLRLAEGQRSTARSVGVRNRMPQGQLVPYSFSGTGIFDSGSPMRVFVKIPDRMYVLVESRATIAFRQFQAPATAASSGGGSTTNEKSLTFGMTTVPTHNHTDPQGGSTGLADGLGGTSVIGSIDPHSHSTPNHSHGLAYGTYEEAFPASHSVTLRTYRRDGTAWTLVSTIAGLTDDLEDVDLTAVLDGPGDWRLELLSAGGQPNGGRLGAELYGSVLGAIQSA